MPKFYRITSSRKEYWETWLTDGGSHIVHWGLLGQKGQSKVVKSTLFRKANDSVQKELDAVVAEGFAEIDLADHATLLIEFAVDGMGSVADVDKRHRLEDRMNDTLGWTGLGACDGGSIGSGTMEVCCLVIDVELAQQVIKADLADTEFADFTRIFQEE